ncbi:sigma-54-dependent transcriptional regulator [Clostridium transplantifaecale]|uniref:sigma-54-dependent transcriptional regulator n=1 Tax=Clostridium transplantifaecale TaxID=2479838 RepID=UPI0013DDC688|nr:sigma-54 dependent transcriptional regulator [Clostridium transplantifaecale]
MEKLLIVDDEPKVLKALSFLVDGEYRAFTAECSKDALEIFDREQISLVLLDVRLGRENGFDVMKKLLERDPQARIIVMTAFPSIDSSIEAIRAGAFYFISKPIQSEQLMALLNQAAEQVKMSKRIESLEGAARSRIIGESPSMKKLFGLIKQVKDVNANVLITGESGTGKELVAREIHFSGIRKDKPFIALNCAALPENLLESELFGYKKGAFTGAVRDEIGIIRRADRGTLFLDEIGEMDLRLQSKLLRFLQEKEVSPIGGQTHPVDVRIICATNRNMEEEMAAGRFRSDLYYRINVINLCIPPLRERMEDIPYLVSYFISKYNVAFSKTVSGITEEAYGALHGYPFYGNIRELENIIQRAILLSSGNMIEKEDLFLPALYIAKPERTKSGNEGHLPVTANDTLKDMEKKMIAFSLKQNDFNRRRTALALDISERSLQYKIKEYGL